MRADQINDRVTGALVAAGCRMVWMGAESGSQRILDAMEKGVRVEQIRDATRRLHGAGIAVGVFLQFGYPGETREDIEATLQLARDLDPDDIGVSVSYPLPGTQVLRPRARRARTEAELGGLRRPRDDVPRDLRAGFLPRAASRRAPRVPRPPAGTQPEERAGAPVDARPRGPASCRGADLQPLRAADGDAASAAPGRCSRAPRRRPVCCRCSRAPQPRRHQSRTHDADSQTASRPLQPARRVLHDAAGARGAGLGARSRAGATSS